MTPLTILIVDDDPDMRLYLRSCLKTFGGIEYVLEAADGLDALPLARSGGADLVISDVLLPRLDGYGLCLAIKADPGLRHLPVLLISGEDVGRSVRSVADGFLVKPFNAGELHAVLDGLLPGGPRAPPDRSD